MTLSWSTSNVNDFIAYKVYYATSANVNEQCTLAMTITVKTVTSYIISGLTPNTTIYCKVFVCDGTSCIASNEVSVATLPPAIAPTITTQPSSLIKCVSETASFSVEAAGTPPLTYQWKKGAAPVGTNQKFSITAVTAGDAGDYTCTVSNGGGSIITSAATLTVNTPSTPPSGAMATPASVVLGGSSTLIVTDGTLGTGGDWKWYKQSCGGTAVGSGASIQVTPTSITTYYVRAEGVCGKTDCASVTVTFKPTYKVTYMGNGSTTGLVPTDLTNYQSNDKVTVLGNTGTLVKTGYTFANWNNSINGNGTSYAPGATFTMEAADVTLYAKWVPNYTVNFDDQNATTPSDPTSLVILFPDTSVNSLPKEPKKTSYVFDGWYTDKKGKGLRFNATFKVTENLTLYANWIIKDKDNNIYSEVTIKSVGGSQTWMVENLKTTRYRDSTLIHYETDPAQWVVGITTPQYCWYGNNSGNREPYGALYNWYAVNDSRNIAPVGWHVPTQDEWIQLGTILNGNDYAGALLKEKDYVHWESPNTLASNSTGFTALPGGHRYYGNFDLMRYSGWWWSSTTDGGGMSYGRYLSYDKASLDQFYRNWVNGYSVRCIRDY
jgi:uncharacterized protein (TIGR02145 family)/uncharacterized repeat protein (TIGR02543 family)